MLKYFSIGNIYTLEDMPYIIYDFDLVQNSSKYSLIIDFFDSKDIEIEILRHRITLKGLVFGGDKKRKPTKKNKIKLNNK